MAFRSPTISPDGSHLVGLPNHAGTRFFCNGLLKKNRVCADQIVSYDMNIQYGSCSFTCADHIDPLCFSGLTAAHRWSRSDSYRSYSGNPDRTAAHQNFRCHVPGLPITSIEQALTVLNLPHRSPHLPIYQNFKRILRTGSRLQNGWASPLSTPAGLRNSFPSRKCSGAQSGTWAAAQWER